MDLVILDGAAERRVSIERAGAAFEVSIDGRRFVVDRAAVGERLRSLVVDGRQFEVSAQSDGDGRYRISALGNETTVEVRDPLRHLAMGSGAQAASDGKRAVTAYMPGRVVAVLVEEGRLSRGRAGRRRARGDEDGERDPRRGGRQGHQAARPPGQSVEGGDLLFEIGDG